MQRSWRLENQISDILESEVSFYASGVSYKRITKFPHVNKKREALENENKQETSWKIENSQKQKKTERLRKRRKTGSPPRKQEKQ